MVSIETNWIIPFGSSCNVGESYCIYILLSMQGKKKVEYFALKIALRKDIIYFYMENLSNQNFSKCPSTWIFEQKNGLMYFRLHLKLSKLGFKQVMVV